MTGQEAKINPIMENISSFIVMDILDRAKELESQGIEVIHLEVGEPDFDVSQCVGNAVTSSVNNKNTHYTHSLGDIQLRKEISEFYRRTYSVEVSPEQILLTSGSSPAIMLVMLLLAHKDAEIVVSNPGYSCYKNIAMAMGCKPRFVDVDDSTGFVYSKEKLDKVVNKNTVAIVVNSPMNPTGTLLDEDSFKLVSSYGIPVISDEIYHGLVYEGKEHSILEYTDNAFVLNGFSKRYAMTGLRLGYVIAPKSYMRNLQILQQNMFICAPSISQDAAIEALRNGEDDVKKRNVIYNERRLYLLQRLRSLGFVIETEPQGAFYVFANAKKFTKDSYKFAFDVLENAHVGITPGIDFGSNGEGYLRFCYANSMENIKKGMDRLEEYLKQI